MAPVATTLMGKGAIDEYHPLSIGCVGMHGRKAANYAVHSCDLLLAIGMRFSDRTCGKFSAFAPHAKIIHAVIDPSEIGKNVRCDVPLVGDAKETLNALIETLPNLARNKTPWSERMREVKEAEMSDLESYDETPLKHQRVIHELSRIVDGRTILVTDVGQHQMWAMHHFKARGPRKFLSSGGLGTMGFALPAAVGAKAARPDEKVVAFVGDGGFLITCQELATSAQENLPFICMVMNNGWLGMVRQWQDIFLEGRHGATNLGSKVDFVKVAQGLGCDGIRASTPGELRDALQAAEKADGTFVVEVMVDPQDSALPMALPGNSTSPGMMLCREKNSGDIFKKYPEGLSNKPADGSKGKGDANDFELVFDVANAG
jgi:acetolactate synthase-1/2/3 large subunit